MALKKSLAPLAPCYWLFHPSRPSAVSGASRDTRQRAQYSRAFQFICSSFIVPNTKAQGIWGHSKELLRDTAGRFHVSWSRRSRRWRCHWNCGTDPSCGKPPLRATMLLLTGADKSIGCACRRVRPRRNLDRPRDDRGTQSFGPNFVWPRCCCWLWWPGFCLPRGW